MTLTQVQFNGKCCRSGWFARKNTRQCDIVNENTVLFLHYFLNFKRILIAHWETVQLIFNICNTTNQAQTFYLAYNFLHFLIFFLMHQVFNETNIT